jgi:hypothetical protein
MANRGLSLLKIFTSYRGSRHVSESFGDAGAQRYAHNTTTSSLDRPVVLPTKTTAEWQQDFQVYIKEHDEFITKLSRDARTHRDSLYREYTRVSSALLESLEPLLCLVSLKLGAIDYADTNNKPSAGSQDHELAAFNRRLKEEDDDFKSFFVALRLMKFELDNQTPTAAGLDVSLSELAKTIVGPERYQEIISNKAV